MGQPDLTLDSAVRQIEACEAATDYLSKMRASNSGSSTQVHKANQYRAELKGQRDGISSSRSGDHKLLCRSRNLCSSNNRHLRGVQRAGGAIAGVIPLTRAASKTRHATFAVPWATSSRHAVNIRRVVKNQRNQRNVSLCSQ